MNVNEVVAGRRANALLAKKLVHPNALHVNKSQSSNDTFRRRCTLRR